MNHKASVPAHSSLTDDELRSVSGGTRQWRPRGPSAEMEMIQLQSMVSQRQLAVALADNVVTSFESSTRSIIDNLGD